MNSKPLPLMGTDPNRPPPPAPRHVSTDYNRWHTEFVLAECYEEIIRRETAAGTCEVVIKRKTRRHAVVASRSRGRGKQGAIEVAKTILASQRVASWAQLDTMTDGEIRAALEDLERRLRASANLGLHGLSLQDEPPREPGDDQEAR